jgi:hypothetical protein
MPDLLPACFGLKWSLMLNYYVLVVFSYSITIAALIGVIRIKSIVHSYRPFVYLCILAVLNEVVSAYSIEQYQTNVINSNIYILLEFYLLLWLFRNWGLGQRRDLFYTIIGIGFTALWIADNFIIHPFQQFNSIYRVCYAIALIFLSIDQVNFIIVRENRNLLKNASFLICIAILIFYSYKGTVEVFYLLEIKLSNTFYNNLFLILAVINLLANIIYAFAALWMPTKQRFITPY